MRTQFREEQLFDPHIADAEASLRACMHCGICTATCPTYVLLGDERDGPRGRIVMMQKMLEEGGTPSPETVLHVDRCLSCLACRTACPSSVDYACLVDLSRAYIEQNYRRPFGERVMRWAIAETMSRPALVRVGLSLAWFFKPIVARLPGKLGTIGRKGASLARPKRAGQRANEAAANKIAILQGCVQAAAAPQVDEALTRVLNRRGYQAIPLEGCCGSLAHHLGQEAKARRHAKQLIESFEQASRETPIEVLAMSATGCVAHLKGLPQLFRGDKSWESRAESCSARVRDVSELIKPLAGKAPHPLRIAYHAACSAQNGLRLKGEVEELLRRTGFQVIPIPEGHLCCGSAGSYSLLQPEIAGALRERKLSNIRSIGPEVVASGNIGCLLHLSGPDAPPFVHYVELVDWAEGGVLPRDLTDVVDQPISAR